MQLDLLNSLERRFLYFIAGRAAADPGAPVTYGDVTEALGLGDSATAFRLVYRFKPRYIRHVEDLLDGPLPETPFWLNQSAIDGARQLVRAFGRRVRLNNDHREFINLLARYAEEKPGTYLPFYAIQNVHRVANAVRLLPLAKRLAKEGLCRVEEKSPSKNSAVHPYPQLACFASELAELALEPDGVAEPVPVPKASPISEPVTPGAPDRCHWYEKPVWKSLAYVVGVLAGIAAIVGLLILLMGSS